MRQSRLNSNLRTRTAAWPACVAIGMALALTACGGASDNRRPVSAARAVAGSRPPAPTVYTARTPGRGGYVIEDGDADYDERLGRNAAQSDDRGFAASAGPPARPADRTTVVALVKRYYRTLASGDATAACALLSGTLANGLAYQGSTQANAGGCRGTMGRLLAARRPQLRAADAATVVVIDVRVDGDLGVALLGFRTAPRASILVEREGRSWRMGALFDSQMP